MIETCKYLAIAICESVWGSAYLASVCGVLCCVSVSVCGASCIF